MNAKQAKALFRSVKMSSAVALLGYAGLALAWGKVGHETVVLVGADLVAETPFFKANRDSLKILTNVPDSVWKNGAHRNEERGNHWFQPDSFFSNSQDFVKFPRQFTIAEATYGHDLIVTNGTAPWRTLQTYDLMVEALQGKDWVRALQMGGAMSHYLGDLSQPLHVTKNYDGQETGQTGLHAYFESSNVQAYANSWLMAQVSQQASQLLQDPKFVSHFQGNITDLAFDEIMRAYSEKDLILNTDKELGRGPAGSQKQIDIAIRRMADGAATVAMVFGRAWTEAQLKGESGATVQVPNPAFEPNNYYDDGSKKAPKSFRDITIQTQSVGEVAWSAGDEPDDCNQ